MDGWVFKVPVDGLAGVEDFVCSEEMSRLRAEVSALRAENAALREKLPDAMRMEIIRCGQDFLETVEGAVNELVAGVNRAMRGRRCGDG